MHRTSAKASFVVAAVTALLAVPGLAWAGHVRPKAAADLQFPLVPAYNACTAPDRLHGPPLAFPSCSPPTQTSPYVTVGTPDVNGAVANMEGVIDLQVEVGDPGAFFDDDVLETITITDVRCNAATTACGSANASGGPDYTGNLLAASTQRTTDHWNAVAAGGGSDPATVVDVPAYPAGFIPIICAATADPLVGATCTANTSANAVTPGAVRGTRRTVVEMGQWRVIDGGPDGATETGSNADFAVTGIFVP